MKIQSFDVCVRTTSYRKVENGDRFNKTDAYYCFAYCYEKPKNFRSKKKYHNIVFFLTEEQFDNQEIKQGDYIRLSDKCDLRPRNYEITSYKKSFIETCSKRELHTDSQGRTYANTTVISYSIMSPQGQWKILSRYNECFVGELGNDLEYITLFFENKDQMKNNYANGYYLTKEEYEKLLPYNNTFVQYIALAYGCPVLKRKVFITLEETGSGFYTCYVYTKKYMDELKKKEKEEKQKAKEEKKKQGETNNDDKT